ncbi:MAG: hypothetical protein AAFR23_04005 [Pseudomonadota bacterium]
MKRVAFGGGSSAASAAAAVLRQPLPEPDAETQSAQQVPTDPSRAKAPAQPGPATTLNAVDGQTAKKTDDQSPTRTASAIDDLLKARDERTSAGSAKRDSAGRSDPETPGDNGSDDDHTQADPAQPERRRARRRPAGLPREHIAANDDQPSIGGLLYALNRKPSNKPFFIATIASAAWLSVGLIFGYFLIAPDLAAATSLGAFVRESAIMTVLATIAGPIALAWFLAFLAWRSEELHLRSTAMTEVAVRLAEPDRMAEQQISSLGQAVRREVTFMNDAVSHALSRANELDSLVQSEVHALERSYEDNERKIRSLLQELASERNSLSGTGEHFKQTLATLAHDVPTLIERLSEQQGKLANIIAGAGENLTTLEHSLATRTGDLQSTLTDQTQALQIVFDSGSEAIGTALESRTDQVQAILTEQAQALGGTLDNHRTGVEETLSGYTNALGMVLTDQNRKLSDQLETQGAALTAALDDRALALTSEFETKTTAMASEIDGRSLELQGAIEKQAGALQASLDTHKGEIQSALTSRSSEMAQMLSEHRDSVDRELDQRMQQIDQSISARTETLQSVFEEYALALDTTLANRATALDTQLVERTKALDEAFDERLRLFDEAILRSTAAIDNAVGDNARALTSAMEQHAATISEGINRQAVELDGTLMQGITAVRETSENISRQSIRAIEGLAGQSEMLKSVSENLLGQINTVTNRFESQGQAILQSANALETANYKIDKSLGKRTEDLNQTLDRLSSKAEEIGSAVTGYSSQIEGSVSQAEERTRLLTAELSREAEARSRDTIDHLARLKTEALREKDRALDDLRREFELVTREVTDRLGTLSTQFSQTSGEVRARARLAADNIQADQDRLRMELERLPASSQESSEAMRRALQDQLRALDQLTQYARQTGVSRDVRAPSSSIERSGLSEPTATTTPTPTPTRALIASSPHSERQAQVSQASIARPDDRGALSSLTSSLARELTQRSSSRPADPGQTQAPARQPTHPTTQRGAAPMRTADPAAAKKWSVGDLLARASLDETGHSQGDGAAPPANATGNEAQADSAALDVNSIAKAIDPTLAAAVWSRFRQGQRGFMVPSIYPQTARALFDETRSRYAGEPAFRANVDHFLSDFEQVLRQADGSDPSGRNAHDQIVTDTGRVYLFLAHASGRLT